MVCEINGNSTSAYPAIKCLNPCFNGRWSARVALTAPAEKDSKNVLILVLMEDGLRAWGPEAGKLIGLIVLILVLMEDGLRAVMAAVKRD